MKQLSACIIPNRDSRYSPGKYVSVVCQSIIAAIICIPKGTHLCRETIVKKIIECHGAIISRLSKVTISTAFHKRHIFTAGKYRKTKWFFEMTYLKISNYGNIADSDESIFERNLVSRKIYLKFKIGVVINISRKKQSSPSNLGPALAFQRPVAFS